MKRGLSFDEISKSLKTGDLVLCHGTAAESHIIEAVEWSYWSHVGMVILPEDIGLENTKSPLFWESTSSSDGIRDVILNKCKANGPMLIPLKDRLTVDITKKYDTDFLIRYLDGALTDKPYTALKGFIDKVHNLPFPDTAKFLKDYLAGRDSNRAADKTTYFCSQLVSDTYMSMGIISDRYVSNGYAPKDFSSEEALPFTCRMFLRDGSYIEHV